MRYPPRDFLGLLRTQPGRRKIRRGLRSELWPLMSRLATLHRRLVVPHVRVVAITGSLGKTTTARAVSTALGLGPDVRGNALVSLARGALRMRRRHRHAVFEVGVAGPGQMAPYARMLRPDVVVVTSIGSEHRRSFGTLESTRAEKAELVRALPETGLAVLNGDDPNVRWMAGETRARVVTFGFEPGNDVRATELGLEWPRGSRLTIAAGGETRAVETRLLGRPMAYPVLAALAVALAEGVALDDAAARIGALEPTTARLEPVPLANGAIVIRDDDKSPLESVEAALDLLAEVPAERRIVVLGDITEPPGSQGPIYRGLGERIAAIAAQAVFLGGGYGYESYAVGARRAGMPREALGKAGRSVLRAAELLRDGIGPGDVVLVEGRDAQKLERIVLALQGRSVACDIPACRFRGRCATCAMLERGWDGLRVVT